MKKKQLLVFIMAGSLAAGMSPVTMAFAEADTQTSAGYFRYRS